MKEKLKTGLSRPKYFEKALLINSRLLAVLFALVFLFPEDAYEILARAFRGPTSESMDIQQDGNYIDILLEDLHSVVAEYNQNPNALSNQLTYLNERISNEAALRIIINRLNSAVVNAEGIDSNGVHADVISAAESAGLVSVVESMQSLALAGDFQAAAAAFDAYFYNLDAETQWEIINPDAVAGFLAEPGRSSWENWAQYFYEAARFLTWLKIDGLRYGALGILLLQLVLEIRLYAWRNRLSASETGELAAHTLFDFLSYLKDLLPIAGERVLQPDTRRLEDILLEEQGNTLVNEIDTFENTDNNQ